MPKKSAICPTCSEPLINCDRLGKPDLQGGYRVCPKALKENQASEFSKPWQRRVHRNVKIEETAKHAKQRREAAKKEQLPAFKDPEVGRRLSKRD